MNMRKGFKMLVVLFVLAVQPIQASAQDGVQAEPRTFEQLKIEVREGSGSAYRDVLTFVGNHSGHRGARLMLARLQLLRDLPDEALDTLAPLLNTGAKHSHPDWQPWFWAGTARLAMGEIDAARDYLEVALSKNSAQADVWVQLAVLEQEVSNHAGALQYLSIANQLAPNRGEIHLNRAYSFEHSGEYEEALKAYQRFVVSSVGENNRVLKPLVLRRISTLASSKLKTQPVVSPY